MLAAVAALSLTAFSLSSCNEGSGNSKRVDCGKYGTIYEIFPYSFSDSNGDGIGDIKGITAKLDYIADLGFTGIWITPVGPSPTYHGYDTTDYYDIRPEFGTLDDYKAMVDRAHELDLTVYLDLVLNHCSTQHEWFTESGDAHVSGNTSDPYYDYFYWSDTAKSGYARYGNTSWYYDHYSGDDQMTKLNLQWVVDDPSCALATEISNIMEFWLVDYDVDGLRLDAVTSFFSSDKDTLAFLSWLVNTAKSYKEDVYIIGEGKWGSTSSSVNSTYLPSGIDSFFCFEDAVGGTSNGGQILSVLGNERAANLSAGINNNLSYFTDGSIPSPFLSNHDQARLIGAIQIAGNSDYLKFAYATLQMYTGSTYFYYGDEVGMTGPNSANSDPGKRTAMPWGDKYRCDNPPGADPISDKEAYPFGTVKKQLKDKNSILNFVKETNEVRNSHQAIFAGSITMLDNPIESFSVNEKTYSGPLGDDSVLILLNASKSEEYTYKISDHNEYSTLEASLCATSGNKVSKSSEEITLPPLTYCILTK